MSERNPHANCIPASVVNVVRLEDEGQRLDDSEKDQMDPRTMLTLGDAKKSFAVRVSYCPFCGGRL